jgi:hypothetical protein
VDDYGSSSSLDEFVLLLSRVIPAIVMGFFNSKIYSGMAVSSFYPQHQEWGAIIVVMYLSRV